MRKLTSHLLVLLLVGVLIGCTDQAFTPDVEADSDQITATSSSGISSSEDNVIPGQYIIVLDEAQSTDVQNTSAALIEAVGGEVRRVWEDALSGFSAELPESAVRILEQDDRVLFVSPNQRFHIGTTVQDDPVWGLDRVDQRDLPLDDQYVYDDTGEGITTYIIDTGIRYSHEEFEGSGGTSRANFGFDAFDDGQNGEDCQGHGTHVAGTVGGITYGVSKEVDLVSVRVLDCNGDGTSETVIDGVNWVSANHDHPSVANMSLWGPIDNVLDYAVENSIQNGISYVVIAGNADADACNYSPARVSDAITVAASNSSDERDTSFSNWGPCVDIFAPGVDIKSAYYRSDTDTGTLSGTSMAAPHVAGIAAIVRDRDNVGSPSKVFDKVIDEATENRLSSIGSGSPNLLSYSMPPSVPDPFDVTISGPSNLYSAGTHTWEAITSNEDGPVNYQWSVFYHDTGQSQDLGTNSTQSLFVDESTGNFTISVEASDNSSSDTDSQVVWNSIGCDPNTIC